VWVKKPLFLTVLVVGSVAAGVVADRNWLRSSLEEGAQCDFLRPPHAATAKPLPIAPNQPCVGRIPQAVLITGTRPLRPDCPGGQVGALRISARPTQAPLAHNTPSAGSREAPAEVGNRSVVIALGALLGLLGLGAAWRQTLGSGRRSRAARAAVLVPGAALADPVTLEELPISDPAFGSPLSSRQATAADFDPATAGFVTAGPDAAVLRNQQRRRTRAARKARWRRLLYVLLIGGSVAAVAASTSRVMWSDDGDPAGQARRYQARLSPPLAGPANDPAAPHSAIAAPPGHGGQLEVDPGARPRPSPGQIVDARGGWSRGVAADNARSRPPAPSQAGERLGAHMFDAHGGNDPTITDPRHARPDDRLTKPGGGGGGSGSGPEQGIGHGNITAAPGDPGGLGHGHGHGSDDGGDGSRGKADAPGDQGGGSGAPRDGEPGSHGNDHDRDPGGDPDKWLGNDPAQGGSTPVPEPDTIGLLALGIAGLVASRSRRLRLRLKLAKPAR
jgi:hypothetical protein